MLACSKRSDSGERCEVKKAMKSRGGLGRAPSLAFILSRSFLLRTAPHYLNAWNRLKDCFFSGPRVVGRNLQTYILTPNNSDKRSKAANLKFPSAETFFQLSSQKVSHCRLMAFNYNTHQFSVSNRLNLCFILYFSGLLRGTKSTK